MAGASIWERIRAWFKGSAARVPGSGVVGIRDEHGAVLVDAETARVATSTAPDPAQRDLVALFGRARRVRVIDDGDGDDEGDGDEGDEDGGGALVLFETGDVAEVAALGRSLAICEVPETFGHCMCMGGPTVEVWDGSEVLARITIHHGRSIRWDEWRWDAVLVDGDALCEWLSARGVTGPQEEVAYLARLGTEVRGQDARWRAAMPVCLAPHWAAALGDDGVGDHEPLMSPLCAALPDVHTRITALYRWFGAGAGPWSGFPSYEEVAENLLLLHETADLVAAAEASVGDVAALEGAARLFGGWAFRKDRPDVRLSPVLRRALLARGLDTTDEDRIARARSAFGGD